MKRLIIAGAFLAAVATGGQAFAGDVSVGTLTLHQAWARASIGPAKAGAAYLTIVNKGDEVDRLLSIETPVAKVAQIHTNIMTNGIMKMRRVEAVEIALGEPVVLGPGGLHIMLMGLKAPLREGESFPLVLTFENAGPIEIPVEIEAPTAMEPTGDSSMPGDHVQGS